MTEPANDPPKAVSLSVPTDAASVLIGEVNDRKERETVIDDRLSHIDTVNNKQLTKLDKLTQVVFEGTETRTSLVAQVERLDERSVRVERKVDKLADNFDRLSLRLDAAALEQKARADAEVANHRNMVRGVVVAAAAAVSSAVPYLFSLVTSPKN